MRPLILLAPAAGHSDEHLSVSIRTDPSEVLADIAELPTLISVGPKGRQL
jgi:hypothetical protein